MTTESRLRLREAYSNAALLILNTIIVFAIFNLVAGLVIEIGGTASSSRPGPLSYPMEKLALVYPGWNESDIEELLSETWSREYVYRPFVQHREAPRQGRYVNIDAAGFRRTSGSEPWPPANSALNVFAFGGSTTFGYGLPDWETIPARMQVRLNADCERPVQVYNFGGGNFYSEQERALFETQLASGIRPDVAVFLDGLNEWKKDPKFTRRLEYLMSEGDGRLALRALKTLPFLDWVASLRNRDSESLAPTDDDAAAEAARKFVDRWLRNRRLVQAAGEAFEVELLFVWQPVPSYGYDLGAHLFGNESHRSIQHGLVRAGYQMMDRRRNGVQAAPSSSDFLWLADLQEGRREPLYVDAAHYTAAFSEEIARRIVDKVRPKLDCGGVPESEND